MPGCRARRGFVGEFLVILAAVKVNFWLGFAAAITLILGAAYTLWMYKRVIFGAVANEHVAQLHRHRPARVLAARRRRGGRAADGRLARSRSST